MDENIEDWVDNSMLCLDSNLVSDYLTGHEPAQEFLDAHQHEDLVVTATTMVELYIGAHHGQFHGDLDDIREAIGWLGLDVLQHDHRSALETARLQRDLIDRRTPLTATAAMIAGVARMNGATLATNDSDFLNDEVRSVLDVVEYYREQ
ncbi:PIN domain-containing protein [Halocatena salina]|uniref:PIN domain-containing protein n=1 Tax=Halocatena salina TaxID=2934340 RepID=A0A8U0A4Y8_9EURY|nr:PIN domain-containing protein [Halocatena salina]UPM43528.1 PIN domain-containing protein [Halocatena salina]